MSKKRGRAYEEIRSAIEQRNGTMVFVRAGEQYGAWVVKLGNLERKLISNGSGFPDLDKLYEPNAGVGNPSHYSDYSTTPDDGAIERFLRTFI